MPFSTSATPSRLHAAPARPGLVETLLRLDGLWRQRRALARLDAHLLADVGLDRATAEAEVRRAAWDVPVGWRR